MKLDRITGFQILISLLSCPLFFTIISSSWNLGPKLFFIMFIYLVLLIFYSVHPWRYKEWDMSTAKNGKANEAAYVIKIFPYVHNYFFGILLFVQAVGSFILLTQVYLPDYAADTITRTVSYANTSPIQSKSSLPVYSTDSIKTVKETSYIATLVQKKGTAYPVNSFLNYTFPFIFNPVWDFILAVWLIFVICVILMKAAEVASTISLFN